MGPNCVSTASLHRVRVCVCLRYILTGSASCPICNFGCAAMCQARQYARARRSHHHLPLLRPGAGRLLGGASRFAPAARHSWAECLRAFLCAALPAVPIRRANTHRPAACCRRHMGRAGDMALYGSGPRFTDAHQSGSTACPAVRKLP